MVSLLLRHLNLKALVWGQAALLFLAVLYVFKLHDEHRTRREEWKTARASLENPRTIEVVKVVRVEGPVKIKTVVVERPTGEKETTTTEERGETTEVVDSMDKSEPVPLSVLAPALRSDRWLVGTSLRNFSPRSYENWGIWGGYSFRGRVDLLFGVEHPDRLESTLLAVIRF